MLFFCIPPQIAFKNRKEERTEIDLMAGLGNSSLLLLFCPMLSFLNNPPPNVQLDEPRYVS